MDFYGRRKKPPLVVGDYADETRRGGVRGTLRAMCEASRGRQLRLIRAETDSGRSDGLLNTLTCRQPSARLHFLHPSPYVACDVTELRTSPASSCNRVAKLYASVRSCQNLSINLTYSLRTARATVDSRARTLAERFFDDSNQ